MTRNINHGRLPKDSRDSVTTTLEFRVDELWLLSGSGSGPRGDFIEPWEDQQDCLWPLGQSVFSLGRPLTGKFDSDSEFERFLESQCLAGKSWSRLSDKLPPADEPLNQTSRSPTSLRGRSKHRDDRGSLKKIIEELRQVTSSTPTLSGWQGRVDCRWIQRVDTKLVSHFFALAAWKTFILLLRLSLWGRCSICGRNCGWAIDTMKSFQLNDGQRY